MVGKMTDGGANRVILETERLVVREMTEDDMEALAAILKDPEVMYAYGHDFTDRDVCEWLDRQRARYARYGFGLWAVTLKTSPYMIGQAGITMQPYKGGEVLEAGWLLNKAYWHSGYAREAAFACVRYAFGTLGADKLCSIIKADNAASIKVAESIGMTKRDEFVTRYYGGDMFHYLYAVDKYAARI